MTSIEYQTFADFYDTLEPLVAPEDLGEELQPFFRDQIGNALSDIQTLIPWFREFNVEFLEKDDVDEFCNTSIFQGPAGKVTQVFAYQHGVDCKKYYYKRASTSAVDCWMERQRYLCPPAAQACLESDFSALTTSLRSWWRMQELFGETVALDDLTSNEMLDAGEFNLVTYDLASERGGVLGAAVFSGDAALRSDTISGHYIPSLANGTTVTIGLWVKLTTHTDGPIFTLHTGTTVRWSVRFSAALSRFQFVVGATTVNADVLGIPNTDQWYWIEAVISTGQISIRVAGERTPSFSPMNIEADTSVHTATVVVGQNLSLGSYNQAILSFDGTVAEVCIWYRALTDCERGAINRPLDYPFPAAVPAIPYSSNYVLAGEVACSDPLLNYEQDQKRFRCTDEDDRIFAVGPDYKVFVAPRFPCGYILLVQWQGIRRKWLDTTMVPVDQQLREAVVNYVEHKLALKERNSMAMEEYMAAYTLNLRMLTYRYNDEMNTSPARDCSIGIEQMMSAFQPLYASPLYGP